MEMKVIKWDDDIVGEMTEEEIADYLLNTTAYSVLPFKQKDVPGWAVPFATGHKYRYHYQTNIDFTDMKVVLSERWEATDAPIYMITNFTD